MLSLVYVKKPSPLMEPALVYVKNPSPLMEPALREHSIIQSIIATRHRTLLWTLLGDSRVVS